MDGARPHFPHVVQIGVFFFRCCCWIRSGKKNYLHTGKNDFHDVYVVRMVRYHHTTPEIKTIFEIVPRSIIDSTDRTDCKKESKTHNSLEVNWTCANEMATEKWYEQIMLPSRFSRNFFKPLSNVCMKVFFYTESCTRSTPCLAVSMEHIWLSLSAPQLFVSLRFYMYDFFLLSIFSPGSMLLHRAISHSIHSHYTLVRKRVYVLKRVCVSIVKSTSRVKNLAQ